MAMNSRKSNIRSPTLDLEKKRLHLRFPLAQATGRAKVSTSPWRRSPLRATRSSATSLHTSVLDWAQKVLLGPKRLQLKTTTLIKILHVLLLLVAKYMSTSMSLSIRYRNAYVCTYMHLVYLCKDEDDVHSAFSEDNQRRALPRPLLMPTAALLPGEEALATETGARRLAQHVDATVQLHEEPEASLVF